MIIALLVIGVAVLGFFALLKARQLIAEKGGLAAFGKDLLDKLANPKEWNIFGGSDDTGDDDDDDDDDTDPTAPNPCGVLGDSGCKIYTGLQMHPDSYYATLDKTYRVYDELNNIYRLKLINDRPNQVQIVFLTDTGVNCGKNTFDMSTHNYACPSGGPCRFCVKVNRISGDFVDIGVHSTSIAASGTTISSETGHRQGRIWGGERIWYVEFVKSSGDAWLGMAYNRIHFLIKDDVGNNIWNTCTTSNQDASLPGGGGIKCTEREEISCNDRHLFFTCSDVTVDHHSHGGSLTISNVYWSDSSGGSGSTTPSGYSCCLKTSSGGNQHCITTSACDASLGFHNADYNECTSSTATCSWG